MKQRRCEHMGRVGSPCRGIAALSVTALTAMPCLGGGVPDYGFDWVTIGAPGNRDTIPSEVPSLPDRQIGGVAYEYRLTRTEVTVGQWFEFAQAYVRWHPEAADNSELTGFFIGVHFDGTLFTFPSLISAPNVQSWRMAARFCNWLHNGKADNPAAFESGAYDAATFTENPDGTQNDQREHSPGALFWIPTHDEWVKGAFYDPNRYGEGQGGYWRYPNTSNTVPVSGLPENGGETNAGMGMPFERYPMPVGSYPDVQSPWGLLDVSGGETEWTESIFGTELSRNRVLLGSRYGSTTYFLSDRPDAVTGTDPRFLDGLRLASAVPAPGSALLLAAPLLFSIIRKR
jgi:hypothetical protein